jgi:hypothetical protein
MSLLLAFVRWTARLSSVLVATVCVLLAVAAFPLPTPSNVSEWAGIVLVTTAGVALLIAWRWELTGALLALTAFGVMALLTPWNHLLHAAVLVMALPAFLYFLDWLARYILAQDDSPHRALGSE